MYEFFIVMAVPFSILVERIISFLAFGVFVFAQAHLSVAFSVGVLRERNEG